VTDPGRHLRDQAERVPARLAQGLDIDEAAITTLRDQVRALVAALNQASALNS
jgi:hypothetical protein